MRTQLSIGEFSTMTHLSVKMLRRYHSGGLLVPAEIDPWTGYRYYTADQIGPAQTIRRLRELDMPVREIADLIGDLDEHRRHSLLSAHLERLEQRLEQTREAVRALRRLIDPGGDSLDVELRRADELVVASITAELDRDGLVDWYTGAMTDLDAALVGTGTSSAGPPGALIDHEIFTADHGTLTVFVPVSVPLFVPSDDLLADPPTAGRVVPMTVPSAQLAVTVHSGNHSDIDVTYGRLAGWVLAQGFTIGGPVRETYLVGPRDTPDVGAWRTEIGWPVAKT